MRTDAAAHASQPNLQTLSGISTTPQGQRLNALKHGGYAEAVVLPSEDAAAFLSHRRKLFHTYRPQTKDEADLVHALAKHSWIAERLGFVQGAFDEQLVSPEKDAAGRVCEPIAHQRQHSGIDVSARWKRVEAMWHGARSKLTLAQKHRGQGLVTGAVKLPKDCYVETNGEVYGPIAQREIVPIPEPKITRSADNVSSCSDGAIGFAEEQKEKGEVAGGEALQPIADAAGRGGAEGLPEAPGNAAPDSNARSDASLERRTAVLPGGDARPTGPGPGETVLPGTSGQSAAQARLTRVELGSAAPLRESGAILIAAVADPAALATAAEPPPGLTRFDQERWWSMKRNPERELPRWRAAMKDRFVFLQAQAQAERDRFAHREELVLLQQHVAWEKTRQSAA